MAFHNKILGSRNLEKELQHFDQLKSMYFCFFPQVSIVWPDQHTSVFDADWLKKRCFSPAARQAMQEELFLNGKFRLYIFHLNFNVIFNWYQGQPPLLRISISPGQSTLATLCHAKPSCDDMLHSSGQPH